MTGVLSDICVYHKNTVDNKLAELDSYISTENMLPNKAGIVIANSVPKSGTVNTYNKGDVLVSNIRPYFKKIFLAEQPGTCSNDILVFRPKKTVSSEYLYCVLQQDSFFSYATQTAKGTKMPRGDKKAILNFPIRIKTPQQQSKITNLIMPLEVKIHLNKAINDNLLQQTMTLFHHMFVNSQSKTVPASEYFDISIGKTPPRKEPQWFSNSDTEYPWVSISDLGSCGLFVQNTSEYVTKDAVSKFNIKIVPDNTVILSFKLTIGRIAITDGAMTTNEAIAHFKTNKPEINEYLYCYLRNFNFNLLGSTSSIATAVNSKIIKNMPFIIPPSQELMKFHNTVSPIFTQIKTNQKQNILLAKIRDLVLQKLFTD